MLTSLLLAQVVASQPIILRESFEPTVERRLSTACGEQRLELRWTVLVGQDSRFDEISTNGTPLPSPQIEALNRWKGERTIAGVNVICDPDGQGHRTRLRVEFEGVERSGLPALESFELAGDSVIFGSRRAVERVVGTPEMGPRSTCAAEVGATATAYRLADLPPDIRDEWGALENFMGGQIADSDAPLLQTDAPSEAESNYPTARFAQAMLVGDKWFVQFEVSLFFGVRTVGYVRHSDGVFRISPGHYFNGPACASIRAALSGVTTPGGF